MANNLSYGTWLRRVSVLSSLAFIGCAGEVHDEQDEPESVSQDALTSATASFQDGVSPSASYAGTTDAMLQEQLPAANVGTEPSLRLDRDYPNGSGKSANAVLRFDVRAIPPGSTIQSATLTVNVTNSTSGSDAYRLFALKRAWSEREVSWSKASGALSWSAAGARGTADRDEAASALLLPTANGKKTVSLAAAGIAALQAWVNDPGKNNGFVIDATNNADGLIFDSADATVATNRPRLAVTYVAPVVPPPSTSFVHPGLHVTRGQLDFVKAKVAAGAEPWTSQLNKAKSSRYANLGWTPKPVSVMQCGNGGSTLDIGCSDSREDALAAYTMTLVWFHTGDQRYAAKAAAILDAWSAKLTKVVFTSGDVSTYNGPLQAAWLAELFPRSAEILRHAGGGWPSANAARFGQMLKNALLPRIVDGWWGSGSNWDNSMANGVINIGVYNDDRATFDKGVALFRRHVPQTFYLKTDGAYPIGSPENLNADGTWKSGQLAKSWHGQVEFGTDRVNGITAETCRDFGHTQMSLASIAQAAETALIQRVDLYTEQRARIIASYEFVASYLNQLAPANNAKRTATVGSWLCGGSLEVQDLPTWEIAYNHFVNRKGFSMPQTAATITRVRKGGSYTNLQMSWETLTHAGVR